MWDKLITLLKEAFSYFVAYKAGQTSARIKQKDNLINSIKEKEKIKQKLKDKEYQNKIDSIFKRR